MLNKRHKSLNFPFYLAIYLAIYLAGIFKKLHIFAFKKPIFSLLKNRYRLGYHPQVPMLAYECGLRYMMWLVQPVDMHT